MSGAASGQALADRVVKEMMANDAISQWLGIKVQEVALAPITFTQ